MFLLLRSLLWVSVVLIHLWTGRLTKYINVFVARTTNKHLWEYIVEAVLNLLRRDVSEYGRHLVQYFGFFVSYANLGDVEKRQLIEVSRLNLDWHLGQMRLDMSLVFFTARCTSNFYYGSFGWWSSTSHQISVCRLIQTLSVCVDISQILRCIKSLQNGESGWTLEA